MKYITSIWITSLICAASQPLAAQEAVDLSGTWSFHWMTTTSVNGGVGSIRI